MDKIEDKALWDVISRALRNLEDEEEIVICSANDNVSVGKIYNDVISVVPKTTLTDVELHGVRSLIIEAVSNEKFFDWEMPTLTGFSAEEFLKIAEKLPKE